MDKFVISLGGSAVFGEKINTGLLKKFCSLIKEETKRGRKFLIVMGGGKICRDFQTAAEKIGCKNKQEKDWVGIYSTRLNARLLMAGLKPYCFERLLIKPGETKDFKKHKILVAGGFKPGFSTDMVAVKNAILLKIPLVVNLSKIAWVYFADPDKDPNAKPLLRLTWQDYFKIIPKKWTPGLNVPFDPIASHLAQRHKIKVIVALASGLKNFQNILRSKPFNGTIIN